jgi:hypothetical protein
MAQSKHAPGPWFVSETLAVGPAGQIIACVRTDHSQAQANARLIAAAPELLAALKRIRGSAKRNVVNPDEIFFVADRAIAKAEGDAA